MNRSEYAARIAAKACVYNRTCAEPLKSERFCAKHLDAMNESSSKTNRATYLERKLSGQCTRHGCKNSPLPDEGLCQPCKDQIAAWAKTSAGKKSHSKSTKARKRRLRSEGLCTECGNEPLITEWLGEICRKKLLDRTRLPADVPRKRATKCSRCRNPGHNARTCEVFPSRGTVRLRIEDFMYSGSHPLRDAQEAA